MRAGVGWEGEMGWVRLWRVTQSGGCVQEGQTWIIRSEKVWRNAKIHVNSNGMCGACLGESYNLILDALCEH